MGCQGEGGGLANIPHGGKMGLKVLGSSWGAEGRKMGARIQKRLALAGCSGAVPCRLQLEFLPKRNGKPRTGMRDF